MKFGLSVAPNPVQAGTRIKMLRLLIGISREKFCTKYSLNFNTLTSIELDRLKISGKQLRKILEAFEKEGIFTNESWVRHAKGLPPTRSLTKDPTSPKSILEGWMNTFLQSDQSVITSVIDGSMEPFYEEGDWVGGLWSLCPADLLGKKCIVQSKSKLHVGILLKNKEGFVLVPHTLGKDFALVPLDSTYDRVAGILWHLKYYANPIPEMDFVLEKQKLSQAE